MAEVSNSFVTYFGLTDKINLFQPAVLHKMHLAIKVLTFSVCIKLG